MTTDNNIIFNNLYNKFKKYMDERIPEIIKNARYKEAIPTLISNEIDDYMDEYGLKEEVVLKLWDTYNEKEKKWEKIEMIY